MFQITRRIDYAVRIMLELGDQPEGQRINAQEVARRTGVPQAFLHKIVADLVKSGLVRTFSGPTGGLVLSRPAASINMLHIVESINGPICLNTCLLRPNECPRDVTCPGHGFWGQLQESIVQQLQDATLDVLAAEGRELRLNPTRPDFEYVNPWEGRIT